MNPDADSSGAGPRRAAEPLRVVVMLGGPSAEREVSLRSGTAVARALASLGHQVTTLDPQTPRWQLPGGTDVVFLALHGTYGEDGTVQRRLEELNVCYTGCDAEASAVAFDKIQTKERCLREGLGTPPYEVIRSKEAGWPAGWRPPLVLKPARQGSSVGLQFVDSRGQWPRAVAAAFEHGSEVLVEERIVGREMTVGILEDQVLPLVEVRPKAGPYNYENKYTPGATEYFCPAPLDEETTRRVQAAGLGAFHAVGGRDYARVDVMLRSDGEPFVLEVNTLPGMTETSLLPKAAAAAGFSYAALCQKMIGLARARSTSRPSQAGQPAPLKR